MENGSGLQQLCLFLREDDDWQGQPLYTAILDLARARGLAGTTVLDGRVGYSAAGVGGMGGGARAAGWGKPLLVVIVDRVARIADLLPMLEEMIAPSGGLITMTDLAGYAYYHPARRIQDAAGVVGDIMVSDVVTVPPALPLAVLLPLLLDKRLDQLLVVDAERRLVGMVTSDDLCEKTSLGLSLDVLAALRAADNTLLDELLRPLWSDSRLAYDVMTPETGATLSLTDSLTKTALLLLEQEVTNLPVVDDQGRLLGLVSRQEIIKALIAAAERAGVALPIVGQVMQAEVLTVTIATPLAALVGALRRLPEPCLLVVMDSKVDRHVLGMISEADLVTRVPAAGRAALLELLRNADSGAGADSAIGEVGTASDLMSTAARLLPHDMSLTAAVTALLESGAGALPVVDAAGRLVGLLTQERVLRALLPQPQRPAAGLPPTLPDHKAAQTANRDR